MFESPNMRDTQAPAGIQLRLDGMVLLYSCGVVYCPKVRWEYTLLLCSLFELDDEAALCSFKKFYTSPFGGS